MYIKCTFRMFRFLIHAHFATLFTAASGQWTFAAFTPENDDADFNRLFRRIVRLNQGFYDSESGIQINSKYDDGNGDVHVGHHFLVSWTDCGLVVLESTLERKLGIFGIPIFRALSAHTSSFVHQRPSDHCRLNLRTDLTWTSVNYTRTYYWARSSGSGFLSPEFGRLD